MASVGKCCVYSGRVALSCVTSTDTVTWLRPPHGNKQALEITCEMSDSQNWNKNSRLPEIGDMMRILGHRKNIGILSSLLRLQPESRGEVRENEGKPVALEEPPAWHLFFCWTWYLKVSPCVGLERRLVPTRRSAERDTLLLQRGGQVAVLHGVEDLRRCLFTVTSAALTSSFTFRFTVLAVPGGCLPLGAPWPKISHCYCFNY